MKSVNIKYRRNGINFEAKFAVENVKDLFDQEMLLDIIRVLEDNQYEIMEVTVV